MKAFQGDTQPLKGRSILFVVRYFYPFIGGLEKRVQNLSRMLARRGLSIAIITSRFYTEYPPFEEKDGVPVYRLPSPRIKVLGAFVFLACLVRFLIKNRRRYQSLHAFQIGYSSAVAVTCANVVGRPSFVHLTDCRSGGDIYRHVKTPWGLIFLALCRRASKIIILNLQMLRELKVIFYPEAHTILIPNAVDTQYYRPPEDRARLRNMLCLPACPIVLFTGRLAAKKGIGLLISAFERMRSPAGAALVIVGTGPEHHRLQKHIKKLRLENSVTIIPAREDVLVYYQCADIFVMPSFHEGLSNSVLEAMACGLPVIATAVSGNTDLVQDQQNGLLVPPNDIDALAAALDELLDNPEKARTLGASGRHFVETQYPVAAMLDRFCALYDR